MSELLIVPGWLLVAALAWWLGATGAAVRRDVLLLEAGQAEGDYKLIALLNRLHDEPILLALRCRLSRGASAAFLPLGLAAALSRLPVVWVLFGVLLGWLLGATAEASGGGALARHWGRARGGTLYGVWAKFLNPMARLLRPLLKLRLPSRAEIVAPIRMLAESQASRTAAGSELGRDERRFLRRMLASTGILVTDILTRWESVRWIPARTPVSEAVAAVRESGHSRLPVVDQGRVIGVVNVKDLLAVNGNGGARLPIRPAYFVRQEVTVRALLEELRAARAHLTVVVDRLGRMVGIVTMEDVLEEIVGELHDEREAPR
jgi:CBS domain-containing protein